MQLWSTLLGVSGYTFSWRYRFTCVVPVRKNHVMEFSPRQFGLIPVVQFSDLQPECSAFINQPSHISLKYLKLFSIIRSTYTNFIYPVVILKNISCMDDSNPLISQQLCLVRIHATIGEGFPTLNFKSTSLSPKY